MGSKSVIIIAMASFMASCVVTQKKVEDYIDKHPEQLTAKIMSVMDANPNLSITYCQARFPNRYFGSSTQLFTDAEAMKKFIDSVSMWTRVQNDMRWRKILDDAYISDDSLMNIIDVMQRQCEENIHTALQQCDRFRQKVIHDTVENTINVEYYKSLYSTILQSKNKIESDLSKMQKQLSNAQDKEKRWKWLAIGTWILILIIAIIGLFILLNKARFKIT